MEKDKKTLPVYQVKGSLIHNIKNNDTVIVVGETACGKSTQIPQFILDNNLNRGKLIGITQPRRVAAISLATRVAEERKQEVGETVGFAVRFMYRLSPATKIKFLTDGLLLRECLVDRMLSQYSVIILDEIHERTVNTDVLLGILKTAQAARKKTGKKANPLKLVLMSATMNRDALQDYFLDAVSVFIPGRTYNVQTYSTKTPDGDYISGIICQATRLHKELPIDHHILVFLPGQDEILSTIAALKEVCAKDRDLELLPLYSALSYEAQMKAITKPKPGVRRIVFSTNIAETSLTIPGIRVVLDCGYVNRKVNLSLGFEALQITRISKAEAYQRAGRAGRECEGECYRMYTNTDFEELKRFPEPEIKRANISGVMLVLLRLGFETPSKFDWLEAPSQDALELAAKELKSLFAVSKTTEPYGMTDIGRCISTVPLPPRFAKLLYLASDYQLNDPITSILAVLSTEPILERCSEEITKKRSHLFSSDGDLLTYMNIMNDFRRCKTKAEFCKTYKLNIRSLRFACKVRRQLMDICHVWDGSKYIQKPDKATMSEEIRRIFVDVLPINTALLEADVYRARCANGQSVEVKIHPTSSMHGTKYRTLHFVDITQLSVGTNYISHVSPIRSNWTAWPYSVHDCQLGPCSD